MGSREPAHGDPAERGHLTLHDRVVEAVIRHITASVPGTVAASPPLSKLTGGTYPRIAVDTAGKTVRVALETVIPWPGPASGVCQQLRRHITEQVHEITGLEVTRVDVTVRYLPPGHAGHPRSGAGVHTAPAAREHAAKRSSR